MSGYFGALQRMAGAPAAGAAARAAPIETGASPSGPARDGASASGSMSQEALADAHTAAQSLAPATPTRAPVAAHAMASSGSAQAAAGLAQGRPAAPDLARHGIDVSVHPAIQAALRWVSGDPFATPVDADRATQRQASSQASIAANSPSARPDSALARRTPAALSPDHSLWLAAHAPGSAPPAAGAPSPATSPFAQEFALDLELPGSVRPLRTRSRRAQADHAGASASPDRVEISIGSIHVSVDAPAAPRSLALPAPAHQRPAVTQTARLATTSATTQATTQAAMHSAFSRSRLPRS